MNWQQRYSAVNKDTFFCGDGVMKVGDEFYPVEYDHRDPKGDGYRTDSNDPETYVIRSRGGTIGLPNKHKVMINWGEWSNSEGNKSFHYTYGPINETPKTAEVYIFDPEGELTCVCDDRNNKNHNTEHDYGYQTTEQAKELIRRAKEL